MLTSMPGVITQYAQDVESTTWTIRHNLGRYPSIDVFVSVNNVVTKILPAEIVYINENVCEVRFSSPRSGFAAIC